MHLVKIHNITSHPVRSYRAVKPEVEELLAFLKEKNGSFEGEHEACFGLHHAQVSEAPWSFFVVDKKWIKGGMVHVEGGEPADKDLWPNQVIINPVILEMPEKVERTVSTINAVGAKEKLTRSVSNKVRMDEGCMSFPHRTAKKKDRYYRIKVKYQIPWYFGLMRTKREWLEGLRAHIFQHEFDHDRGVNMYWGDRVK